MNRLSSALIVPTAVLMIALGPEITLVLFAHGNTTSADTIVIADVMRMFEGSKTWYLLATARTNTRDISPRACRPTAAAPSPPAPQPSTSAPDPAPRTR
jgi:hypothetical protein